MSPILGIWASQNYSRSTTAFESIATVTASGSSATLSFTSIPGTYKHLQIRGIYIPTGASWIVYNFNSDTAAPGNYTQHDLRGTGSAAQAESVAPQVYGYYLLGTGTATNTVAVGVMDILDYTNTNKYKTTRSLSGMDLNGSGNIDLTSGLWMNTAAVTRIDLSMNSGTNIPSGTTFALYGIKG